MAPAQAHSRWPLSSKVKFSHLCVVGVTDTWILVVQAGPGPSHLSALSRLPPKPKTTGEH